MSKNNSRKVSYAYAPARFARLPYRNPSITRLCTEDDDTTDQRQSTSQGTPSTQLRDKDNFDRIANIAREAYDATRVIMGELNVEDKVFQIQPQTQFFDWYQNAPLQLVNAMAQNVNEAGRVGDSIKMKGIHLSFRVVSTGTIPANTAHMFRIMLVYHPAGQTIINNFPSTASSLDGLLEFVWGSTLLAPLAPRDYDSMDKGEILWEHTGELTPDKPMKFSQHYVKIKRKTQFENDSSAINTGALTLAFVSDKNTATYQLACNWATRLYFVDN